MITTIRPVRAIKKMADGICKRVVNAMEASQDAAACRRAYESKRGNTNIDKLLTGLPRQSLEAIIKQF